MKGKECGDYRIPEDTVIKEVSVDMWSNGNGMAYQDKRQAVYACAIGSVCLECGKHISGKTYTKCDTCRDKAEEECYLKLEEVKWDGTTPLTIYMSDKYFFGIEDIESFLEDCDPEIPVEDLNLVVCENESPPEFELSEYLVDFLPEGTTPEDLENKEGEHSTKEVEDIVNDWLYGIKRKVWYPSNKRVSLKKGDLG